MGKAKKERSLEPMEAMAKAPQVRVSPRKLALVANLIQGKPVTKALEDLTYSKKRIAQEVKVVLESAISNAENNNGLDIDRLIVREASVGRGTVMNRIMPRARGRASAIRKPYSKLRIIVRQVEEGK